MGFHILLLDFMGNSLAMKNTNKTFMIICDCVWENQSYRPF